MRGILARQDLSKSSELLVRLSPLSNHNFFPSHSTFLAGLAIQFTMSLLAVNTVDRLDRPSAYYVGKVKHLRLADFRRVCATFEDGSLMDMRRISDVDITTAMMTE